MAGPRPRPGDQLEETFRGVPGNGDGEFDPLENQLVALGIPRDSRNIVDVDQEGPMAFEQEGMAVLRK